MIISTRWDMAKYPIKQSLKNLSEIISKQVSFKIHSKPKMDWWKTKMLLLWRWARSSQNGMMEKLFLNNILNTGEPDRGGPEEQISCIQCPQVQSAGQRLSCVIRLVQIFQFKSWRWSSVVDFEFWMNRRHSSSQKKTLQSIEKKQTGSLVTRNVADLVK